MYMNKKIILKNIIAFVVVFPITALIWSLPVFEGLKTDVTWVTYLVLIILVGGSFVLFNVIYDRLTARKA